VILGVDGGNTKTLAVVARPDGELVAATRGGQTDLYNAPSVEVAVAELYRTVFAVLERAGVDPSELSGAGLSMAGADWDEDFEVHRVAAERALPGVPVRIVNDAIGPIRVLGRDGPAASMMCGTGAAIGARGADGSVFSLGFTPRSGSAHGLGREALAAVQEADMGDAPPTDLTRRILLAVGVPDVRGLVREFSRRDGLTDIASLAPLVLVAADEGDEVALAIVELIGGRMGRWTRHAARQVGVLGAFRLLLGGGLLRQPGSERFLRAALAELPDADAVRLEAEPVLGALLLGFDAAGLEVDEVGLLERHPSELIC
jgi:N-acetylglucosamine kinase-like BadF-type ATPase